MSKSDRLISYYWIVMCTIVVVVLVVVLATRWLPSLHPVFGTRVTFVVDSPRDLKVSDQARDHTIELLNRRSRLLHIEGFTAEWQGRNRLIAYFRPVADEKEAIDLLKRQGLLELYRLKDVRDDFGNGSMGARYIIRKSSAGHYFFVDSHSPDDYVIDTPNLIKGSVIGYDNTPLLSNAHHPIGQTAVEYKVDGSARVSVALGQKASEQLLAVRRSGSQPILAVTLDGEVIHTFTDRNGLQDPMVISEGKTRKQAEILGGLLRSGPMPVRLRMSQRVTRKICSGSALPRP